MSADETSVMAPVRIAGSSTLPRRFRRRDPELAFARRLARAVLAVSAVWLAAMLAVALLAPGLTAAARVATIVVALVAAVVAPVPSIRYAALESHAIGRRRHARRRRR